ncbi:translation elongation factor Ts [Candidatus Persebacteraceae bacterium Df01]|jgi:elongation factor Ts|uniref:Elongation factor Ts n=1 Tax=Candidatus Doriopsillibacter californiensis TaxID=2970740 RepID=A0ABT7QMW1_9GAMM|nr:translation elongation factor Ts [Candidatus Persebacteraceae bacterium Df01]
MTITASMVKNLRETTGLGMMECKKALTECDGDFDKATDLLRVRSGAKAERVSGRTAAEGRIAVSVGNGIAALAEVNCETDFVARDDDFRAFCQQLADAAAAGNNVEKLILADDRDADTARQELIMKIGENVIIGRVATLPISESVAHYLHTGDKIAAMLTYEGGNAAAATARDICMHIAAMRPKYLSPDDVPSADVEKERTIFIAQAAESGKPPEVAQKIVEGKLNKHFSELTLLKQSFVKDGDKTVQQVLDEAGIHASGFRLLAVGSDS